MVLLVGYRPDNAGRAYRDRCGVERTVGVAGRRTVGGVVNLRINGVARDLQIKRLVVETAVVVEGGVFHVKPVLIGIGASRRARREEMLAQPGIDNLEQFRADQEVPVANGVVEALNRQDIRTFDEIADFYYARKNVNVIPRSGFGIAAIGGCGRIPQGCRRSVRPADFRTVQVRDVTVVVHHLQRERLNRAWDQIRGSKRERQAGAHRRAGSHLRLDVRFDQLGESAAIACTARERSAIDLQAAVCGIADQIKLGIETGVGTFRGEHFERGPTCVLEEDQTQVVRPGGGKLEHAECVRGASQPAERNRIAPGGRARIDGDGCRGRPCNGQLEAVVAVDAERKFTLDGVRDSDGTSRLDHEPVLSGCEAREVGFAGCEVPVLIGVEVVYDGSGLFVDAAILRRVADDIKRNVEVTHRRVGLEVPHREARGQVRISDARLARGPLTVVESYGCPVAGISVRDEVRGSGAGYTGCHEVGDRHVLGNTVGYVRELVGIVRIPVNARLGGIGQHNILVTAGRQLEVGVVVRPVEVGIRGGGVNVFAPAGGKYHQVLARTERDVNRTAGGKLPLIQVAVVIRQEPSSQIDLRIGRVVQLDPIRVVSVAIKERSLVVGHKLVDHNRTVQQQTWFEQFEER